ncbi:18S rRNA maturation protein [Malassezia vespertilionis]|uniref:18S rRNA maturation protein n=1 Tax=Malassezia vespertilionis TaxID=2020962 RepID=UPI0024B0538D|nr:18S rRNA maturation protein [Malassezia vespertilionis]WFD04877.1 18S rRNA maturation protein [Malassezia vespertilionis]
MRPREDAPKRKAVQSDGQGEMGVNRLKNDITPGQRIDAERRLHALERELESKQQAQKERTLASRYHKVKFFERQKLCRRIAQLRRARNGDVDKKAAKKKLAALQTLRMFLHYVMLFPHDKRYVALFADSSTGEPVAPSEDAPDKAHREAAEFLRRVRKQMKKGVLAAEPERELEERGVRRPARDIAEDSEEEAHEKKADPPRKRPRSATVEGDDFFSM